MSSYDDNYYPIYTYYIIMHILEFTFACQTIVDDCEHQLVTIGEVHLVCKAYNSIPWPL